MMNAECRMKNAEGERTIYFGDLHMGRQIPIATTWADELMLLEHLAADSDIRIFRSVADSPKGLWIEGWRKSAIKDCHYRIWPTYFFWKPVYRQIKRPCAPEVEGKWVMKNDGVGPVIAFSRHLHREGSAGRLYWAKHFLATEPLCYDVEDFDRYVSALWRWIRKNGVRDARDPHKSYVLPDALRSRR